MLAYVRSPCGIGDLTFFFAAFAVSFSHYQGTDKLESRICLENDKGKAGLKHRVIIRINF